MVLAVVGCILGSADTALAAGGGGDPGDPIVTTVQASLTVSPAGGTITGQVVGGTGQIINCGSDCSENLDYTQTCEPPPGPRLCDDDHVIVRLTATRSGYTPHWNAGDCDFEPSANVCDVEVVGDQTVGLTWTDSSPPSVSFNVAPGKAGPATVFSAGASDNTGVIKEVDFYVDGVLSATDPSAPYQYHPDLAAYTDGTTHTLKVIAQDPSGNVSSDLASAPSHSFTVDKSTSVTSLSTPPAFVDAPPSVTFTPPADLVPDGATCTTKRGSTTTDITDGCTSPYTAQLGVSPADGLYAIEIRVVDDVGNSATATRTFTLDTTDPQIQFTGGPSEGAVVTPSLAYDFSVTDANATTLSCKLDTGSFGACSGGGSQTFTGLPAGAHTLSVRAVDPAGNETVATRSFTVDPGTAMAALATPPALVNAAPSVAFTPPSDLKPGGVTCRTKHGTTVLDTTTGCTSPYAAALGASPADGEYTLEFTVEDQAGNVATATRTFGLDKTNPQLQITGGPAESGVVQSRATSFNFTSSDANGVTLSCKLDGAAYGPCSGADSHGLNGLSLGSHTFAVRAVDGAGNITTVQRTFMVEDPSATPSNAGDQGSGSGTQPGGDTPAQTGTGQAGSGQTTNPDGQDESADPPVVAARSSAKFAVKSGKTKVSKLKLSGLTRGMVVEVTCKGKGCPRGTTKFTVKKTSLDLSSVFKKRTLGAGAKIEVRVTQSGRRGKLFRYTTQKGSKKPTVATTIV